MQDVFLVVCRRLGDYQERGLTRSWLYSICSRVAKELRRGQRRELVTGEKFDWATEPTQLESVQEREALAFGHSLLEQLPLHQREVFVLYEIEDMSGPEIAQALGCPLQTVYSRLNSARARVLSSVRLSELRTSAARARFTPDS